PRPETEEIVHKIYQVCKVFKVDRPIKILDLGTGSGCIAIALKKMAKSTFDITASDISPAALKVARQNAKKHRTKIKFTKSDLFKNIKGKFDLIVANLPYVPKKVYGLNFDNLKYEPVSALTDGTKSFQIYRRFFEQIGGHLSFRPVILLEIDPSSREFVTEYQKKFLPSAEIKFYKDFNNFWRYAEIKIS
ncbi:MAG: HemK/PrmC family methyltransferase, partial [Candidatus Paceibacterales bacterium]